MQIDKISAFYPPDMKFFYLLISFCLAVACSQGQQLQQVAHCPSSEVYDLLVDKKGFLWVAHNLGISRYDGISFTNFSHHAQSSLSVTDLIEDNYGRIWCHNFNGQIFYVQNDKMYYLEEYDFKKEVIFPRMVLYGNELVITSAHGLFICNTATLKCKLIPVVFGLKNYSGFTGLFIVKNTVVVYANANTWYTYRENEGLKPLNVSSVEFSWAVKDNVKVQTKAANDMGFAIDAADGLLYGITLKQNMLKQVLKVPVKGSINTISLLKGKVWINTNSGSFVTGGKDTLRKNNLTSIVQDKEGNTWFSSLNDGVLVDYKQSKWKNIQPGSLPNGDFICCLKKAGHQIITASQSGEIFVWGKQIHDGFLAVGKIPLANGYPVNIQSAFNNHFFIETSKKLYLLDAGLMKMKLIDDFNVKDIALFDSLAFLATSSQLVIKKIEDWGLNKLRRATIPFVISDSLLIKHYNNSDAFLKKTIRCRAVLFDTATNSLLVSFSDGLQRLKNNKLSYILYGDQPLYVSCLARYGNKIYAATVNNGLFIVVKNSIAKAESNTESPLDGIVRIKLCERHLWIFRAHDIEVLDVVTNKLTHTYSFPVEFSDITDAEEANDSIYLATKTGLYTISSSLNEETIKVDPTLLYVLVNNNDTIVQANISLPAYKNNLLFRFAIPFYDNASQLHFKYRLLNGNSSAANTWYFTQDGQRDIQFNALTPGSYTIELQAVKDNQLISNNLFVYTFAIDKPWYNTWWFYTAVLLSTVAVSLGIYRYRLYQLVKMERMRRKISNDLHDDIGSTLSSINVYSQLAKSDRDNGAYIDTIQTSAVTIINSLDDLVWNINPQNDLLEQLVARMQLFALPLLREKGIECNFNREG